MRKSDRSWRPFQIGLPIRSFTRMASWLAVWMWWRKWPKMANWRNWWMNEKTNLANTLDVVLYLIWLGRFLMPETCRASFAESRKRNLMSSHCPTMYLMITHYSQYITTFDSPVFEAFIWKTLLGWKSGVWYLSIPKTVWCCTCMPLKCRSQHVC